MARLITASLLLSIGAGCAVLPDSETIMRGMYNVASSGTSKFDGTKHIRVSNMNCTGTVMFALYQDTAKSKAGVVFANCRHKVHRQHWLWRITVG